MVKRKCIGFMLAAAIVGSSLMTTTNQVSAYNNESLDTAQSISREVSIPYHTVDKNNSNQMAELQEYLKSREERGCIIRETTSEAGNVVYEVLYDIYSDGNGNILDAKIERRIELVEIKEVNIDLPAEGTTMRYKQSEINDIPELKAQVDKYINYAYNNSDLFEVVETTYREEGRIIRRMDINKIREGKPGSDFYCAIEIEQIAMASMWQQKEDRTWEYYDENGSLAKGLYTADWNGVTARYYFNENGVMASNKWVAVDGKWYFCQKDGSLASGWLTRDNGNTWYYLNDSFVMQTGWQQIEYKGQKQWFFFENSGKMKTGWAEIDDEHYYFDEKEGTMATNRLVDKVIIEDGQEKIVQYQVGANGAWDGTVIYPAHGTTK